MLPVWAVAVASSVTTVIVLRTLDLLSATEQYSPARPPVMRWQSNLQQHLHGAVVSGAGEDEGGAILGPTTPAIDSLRPLVMASSLSPPPSQSDASTANERQGGNGVKVNAYDGPAATPDAPVPAAAHAAAAAEGASSPPIVPSPAVTTRHQCHRMEPWGDVCLYHNLCMTRDTLYYFREDGSKTYPTTVQWSGGWHTSAPTS